MTKRVTIKNFNQGFSMDKILKFKLAKLSSMLWRDTIKYIYYQHGLRNDNKGGFKLHERGKLVSILSSGNPKI